MDLKLFSYKLPEELIAQKPADQRDMSRLLVYDRSGGSVSHRRFGDISEYLHKGDLLVMNDSRVIKARLKGVKRGTGAQVELLLISEMPGDAGEALWEAMAKPAKRLRAGDIVDFAADFTCEICAVLPDGKRAVRFSFDREKGDIFVMLESYGSMPLPPYIKREAEKGDDERYQTVYSRVLGSVAAPTAGLHFTDELLGRLRERGVGTARVTLHVGPGTFLPVKSDQIEEHHMHRETYTVSDSAADEINRAVAEKRRVICVGTTSLRTIESASPEGSVMPGSGSTDIFIYPGYEFRVCDALITNFHLPCSTLLMLVSAFAGREEMLAVYEEAIREGYRFFSYGDAMLIL